MQHLRLASIHIYPVKSLGGFAVPQVRLTDRGLERDRRWMLLDDAGRFLSQRELPRMACLHCGPSSGGFTVTDQRNGSTIELPWSMERGGQVAGRVWEDGLDLWAGTEDMHRWFSKALEKDVRLAYMPDGSRRMTDPRYADAPVALQDGYPALVISQASLDTLNASLKEPVPMERFRPNLVIAGGTPYQEDRWASFQVGTVRFAVVKPCARCIIVNTDQRSGERGQEPLRTLAATRAVGNKAFFGQNAVHDSSGILHVGDMVVPRPRS